MKELYYIIYSNSWGSGIKNKINNHIRIFNKNGFVCKKIYLEKKHKKYKIKGGLLKVLPFCSENDYSVLNKIPNNSYIYIRYGKLDFLGLINFFKLKKRVNKVLAEIPTYPYDNELKGLFRIFFYKDLICRRFSKKIIDYYVTYSDDDMIYNVKTIKTSNYVEFEKIDVVKNIGNKGKINLIAVAEIAFWHGYDRVIEGLKKYYENEVTYNIYFHMVGEGKELRRYKALVNTYRLNDYVIFYGKKEGNDLNVIYEKADIALDSLGRHRSKVFYNSSLKGKEYLAKGLPIVSGVETELDHIEGYKYYFRVPANDSAIDMNAIIKFYETNILNNIYRHQEIRRFAEIHFSPENCFLPIIEVLKLQKN